MFIRKISTLVQIFAQLYRKSSYDVVNQKLTSELSGFQFNCLLFNS